MLLRFAWTGGLAVFYQVDDGVEPFHLTVNDDLKFILVIQVSQ